MPLTQLATNPVLGGTSQTFRSVRTLTAPFTAGRHGAGQFKVTQRAAGANMSVDVSQGLCLVAGSSIPGPAGQHKYWVALTPDTNLATITAPVAGTRVDAVIVQVFDQTDIPGDTTSKAEIQYLVNPTVDGNPMDLSAKGNYLHLANVRVASGAASVTNADITVVAPLIGLIIPGEDGKTYRLGVDAVGDVGVEPIA